MFELSGRELSGRGIAVAAAVLTLASCGDKPTASVEQPARTQPGGLSSVSTLALTPLTRPDARGDDFDHVVQELVRYQNQLASRPEPTALDALFTPEANVLPALRIQLQTLVDSAHRYEDSGIVVHSVVVSQRVDSNLASVNVVTSHATQRVVDANGHIVFEGAGWEQRLEQYVLQRGVDGYWRIADARLAGPVS